MAVPPGPQAAPPTSPPRSAGAKIFRLGPPAFRHAV